MAHIALSAWIRPILHSLDLDNVISHPDSAITRFEPCAIYYQREELYQLFSHDSFQLRNTFSAKDKDDKSPRQRASEEVNSSPNGISGALRSLENVGARIKSSRSLQSLELATSDSLRNVRDRTSDLGENMRRRYGSQLSIAMGRYEQLDGKDDLDCYSLDWRKWRNISVLLNMNLFLSLCIIK